MNHWYVYHSQKTMRHSYKSLGESVVYSTKQQPKLGIGDMIWVIEGDMSKPTEFSLVDCFRYSEADQPSQYGDYSNYKLKIEGQSLLKNRNISLNKSIPWFGNLHNSYITKQKFFVQINSEKEIIKGLFNVSNIAI